MYDYYLQLVEKIKDTSSFVYLADEILPLSNSPDSKVKLRFEVSREGDLVGEPAVIWSEAEKEVEETAKEIIRKSCPFPPFPDSKKKKQQTYEIMLTF
ncbi:MAG: TonB C-terminal domain-containing protein [Candidatus Omnitrophota bacterium]|nr:MAG: TonB C-terminal domain-containing protein [Candidatus Omnitrophota bacterium]